MKNKKSYKPDWVPENAGKEFAIEIKKGVSTIPTIIKKSNKYQPSIDDYVNGVLNNNRTLLAKTITLIESNSEKHFELAHKILKNILPYSGKSIRIGISGVPGAGKSTFIEAFGIYLINKGYKVAVLTVDPSSSVTKGSILGDKTRMEKLSTKPECFIRPSPSSCTLGGVTRKSRETITICEAAGYNIILIETVGVGQNEIAVRSMVDFFLLIMIPGAGDELQGIKRGVIEIADALLINKAEGDNKTKAEIAKTDFSNALHYLKPNVDGWNTPVETCSAINNIGIDKAWEIIDEYINLTKKTGFFETRRKQQSREWFHSLVENGLKQKFNSNKNIQNLLPKLEEDVVANKIFAIDAVKKLLSEFIF